MTKDKKCRHASPRLLDQLVIWLANFLLGYPRYRVRFTYRDSNKREIFHFNRIIGVSDSWYITQHREIKRELGPVWNMTDVRGWLQNGTLEVEPLCYLGRWKNR